MGPKSQASNGGAEKVRTEGCGPNPEKIGPSILGPRRVGSKGCAPKGRAPKGGRPKISLFFFPSPAPFSLFFVSLWVSSR